MYSIVTLVALVEGVAVVMLPTTEGEPDSAVLVGADLSRELLLYQSSSAVEPELGIQWRFRFLQGVEAFSDSVLI